MLQLTSGACGTRWKLTVLLSRILLLLNIINIINIIIIIILNIIIICNVFPVFYVDLDPGRLMKSEEMDIYDFIDKIPPRKQVCNQPLAEQDSPRHYHNLHYIDHYHPHLLLLQDEQVARYYPLPPCCHHHHCDFIFSVQKSKPNLNVFIFWLVITFVNI